MKLGYLSTPGNDLLTSGMLILVMNQTIHEAVQEEVQEVIQGAFMVQGIQEVLEVILVRVQAVQVEVLAEVHPVVLADPTIHPIEVIMEMMEMQQL